MAFVCVAPCAGCVRCAPQAVGFVLGDVLAVHRAVVSVRWFDAMARMRLLRRSDRLVCAFVAAATRLPNRIFRAVSQLSHQVLWGGSASGVPLLPHATIEAALS